MRYRKNLQLFILAIVISLAFVGCGAPAATPVPTPTPLPTATPTPTATPKLTATEIPATHTAAPPETEPEPCNPERVFTPQQLQEDLQVLHTTLQEAHPSLYLYTDRTTRDAQFGELFAHLDHAMTELEFLRLINPFITAIHDGHTWMSPSAECEKAIFSELNVLIPFSVSFIDGRAYVDWVLASAAEISRGTEVLEINGIPMPTIVNRLLQFVPHDGHGETMKYASLGAGFPLVFAEALHFSATYEVETRDPMTGEEETVQLAAISHETAEEIAAPEQETRQSLGLEFLEDEGIAIITMGSFADPRCLSFVESSFKTINDLGVQDLIIDLRWNTGGDEHCGAMLYSYLTDKEFRYYDRLESVIDEPLTYLEHTDWSVSEQAVHLRRVESLERTESGAVSFPHYDGLHELQDYRLDNYKGDVYFLIGGWSFSATGDVVAIAHHNQRGVFVGEETGAAYYSATGGGELLLTLPNTKIRVEIPRFRFVMAVSGYPHSDRGLIPDYPVTQSVEDFINGVDTQMEFTLDLIRQNQ